MKCTRRGASTRRRLAVVVNSASSMELRRVEGATRFLFADGAAHFVEAGLDEFLRIERRFAGEQFVEQHAEAVNIGAGVDIQPAHFSLFRADVGGRADEFIKLGVNSLVGQPAFGGLGDAEVNHLGHGHAVVERDKYI